MNAKTYQAVGELVQAAAHQHGIVGPVAFTVCRPHPSEISDSRSQIADPDTNSRPVNSDLDAAGFPYGEFFYARH